MVNLLQLHKCYIDHLYLCYLSTNLAMKKIYLVIILATGCCAVFSQTPVINVTPTGLDGFIATWSNLASVATSQTKSYTVSGTNLVGDINIYGGSSGYGTIGQTSLTETPFVPADIHLTPVAGNVPATTIYVRIRTGYIGNVYDIIPNFSSGAVTKNVGIIGDVLAQEPTVPGSISFGAKTGNSIEVNLTGGDGGERILFVKESSAVDIAPADGSSYNTGSGVYGIAASQVGNGNYAVYKGSSHAVTVTGLTANKIYHFAVFEYNALFDQLYPPCGGCPYVFSGWNYLLTGGGTGIETTGSALPILVNYIKGTRQGSKHLLNWKVTCISSPHVTMVLERSADSRNFTPINTVSADAVRCNQPFDYTDTDPLKGMNYYRLKMTDADGKVTYSEIVALLNAVKGFDIVSIAPNPVVSDNLKLNIASAQSGKMDMTIFDMQGRLVNRQTLSLLAGFNSLPVNVGNLAPGTYTIRAGVTDEQLKIIRFVKQ
jgi:Secretion system C-terminal sorting domain